MKENFPSNNLCSTEHILVRFGNFTHQWAVQYIMRPFIAEFATSITKALLDRFLVAWQTHELSKSSSPLDIDRINNAVKLNPTCPKLIHGHSRSRGEGTPAKEGKCAESVVVPFQE